MNQAELESGLAHLAIHAPEIAFSSSVHPEEFQSLEVRRVWTAARELYTAANHTRFTLEAKLKGVNLDGFKPVTQPIEYLASKLQESYVAAQLATLPSKVTTALASGDDPGEVVDRTRRWLDKLERTGSDHCVDLSSAAQDEMTRLRKAVESGQKTPMGLPTGLGLERVVPCGIPKDMLTFIFGETGTFKTTVKTLLCDAITKEGHHVLDFTIEDSTELAAQRFLARHTGIPYGRIAANDIAVEELELLEQARVAGAERAKRIHLRDGSKPATISEVIKRARRLAREVPLAAVFIDYIQLMDIDSTDTAKEYQQLYGICKSAQKAAYKDKIAYVLVSQCNRSIEGRTDKRPLLNDMYGSSAMQQTTKLALGVYRPSKYEPIPGKHSHWHAMYHQHPEGKERYKGALELWVRKNVFGESDVFVPVVIDPRTGGLV